MADDYTPGELEAYLDEALPAAEMARLEQRLRDEAPLRERLADVLFRRESGSHSLGEIWRRNRVSCPTREQLSLHLASQLPSAESDYVKFHLESVGCRYCQANIDDLTARQAEADEATTTRRQRFFDSSAGRKPRRKK